MLLRCKAPNSMGFYFVFDFLVNNFFVLSNSMICPDRRHGKMTGSYEVGIRSCITSDGFVIFIL